MTTRSTSFPLNSAIPDPETSAKHRGLGDIPGPLQVIAYLFERITPSAHRKLQRTMTVPSIATLEKKSTKWLRFDGLVVGRNSYFRTDTLTDHQLEEIGGTEYRALRLLSYLVPAVSDCFPYDAGLDERFALVFRGHSVVRLCVDCALVILCQEIR